MSRLFPKLLRSLHRRFRRNRKTVAVETPVLGPLAQPPATEKGRPLDAAAYRAALAALPAERRELLELHQIHGLSFGEIAEGKGVAVADVEREIATALGHLALALEADDHG